MNRRLACVSVSVCNIIVCPYVHVSTCVHKPVCLCDSVSTFVNLHTMSMSRCFRLCDCISACLCDTSRARFSDLLLTNIQEFISTLLAGSGCPAWFCVLALRYFHLSPPQLVHIRDHLVVQDGHQHEAGDDIPANN